MLMGEPALADEATKRSKELRGLLEQRFWLEDRQYYAMALDKDKIRLKWMGLTLDTCCFAMRSAWSAGTRLRRSC